MDDFILLRKNIIKKEFSSLNDMQLRAVFQVNGPLLIIAGAGSGKTTTMVNRIAYLIRFGNAYNSEKIAVLPDTEEIKKLKAYLDGNGPAPYDLDSLLAVEPARPWQILAITFTNKAANELKDRLSLMLGEDGARDIWASTFHSCCAKILRRFSDRLGYSSSFTIYDTDDTKRLIKTCMRQLDVNEKLFPPKSVLSKISDAKNYLITPEEYERQASENANRDMLTAKLYRLYQDELRKANAMDFDDLIMNTVILLEQEPDVREYYQRKFKYVLVDEYQDTNFAQFRLTQLLADGWGNICVVGDDDQSIYRFRGATIENILGFEKQYRGCKVIKLEQNYRSTQTILNAANAVIAHNEGRKGKNLWTNNGSGERVVSYLAADQNEEGKIIAEIIGQNVASGRYKYSDHAVLYRANAQSNFIESAFMRNAISYRIFGGHRFYERAEIRDMIAYLTVINNPDDTVKLMRIINVPARGIGASTVNRIQDLSTATGRSAFDIICHADEFNILQRSSAKLMSFAQLISELRDVAEEETLNSVYLKMIEAVGYEEYLNADKEKGPERLENVHELSSNLITYQEENGDEASLQSFLEEVSLLTDIDNYNSQADAAVMMTLHSAKGLEFPVVFIPGMEEGVFPVDAARYDPVQIEEERRLAYVGITRAKEKLYLLHTSTRTLYGAQMHNQPSRFLSEVPEECLQRAKSQKLSGSRHEYTYFNSPASGGFSTRRTPPFIPSPRTEEEPAELIFSIGERVRSGKFGDGTVIGFRPLGKADALVEIAFDTQGTKKLMAKTARLKKI